MNTMHRGALVLAGLLAVPVLGAATKETRAQDTEVAVKASQVPAAVLDSLHVHYPKAHLLGFALETKDGTAFFEAAMTVGKHHVDALLDSVGTFQEIETQLDPSELPDAVLTAFRKSKAAGGKVVGAELHVVPGSAELPSYELHVSRKGEVQEVVIDAKGRLLSIDTDPDGKD